MRRYRLKLRLFRWCCYLGLHFLNYEWVLDGFVCYCRQQHLWADQIRDEHIPERGWWF